MNKRVLIAGFTGAMGAETIRLIASLEGFEVVAGLAPHAQKDPLKYGLNKNVKIFNSLAEIPANVADIWVDFTSPSAVFENIEFALKHHIRPLVGTTGLSEKQETTLVKLAQKEKLGGLIAPNFGMSAVLLMKFAREAAKYFPDVEIIEMHHADKKDAPSGTALATAKLISQVREAHESAPNEETLENVRGGDYQGIKIHSVRLPGYIAHEQVLFGAKGEALTIRQDSFDRSSFMSGVKVGLEKIMNLKQLVIGLENIL
ncbi:4-hydroxy-tetrahydrodipicolinate reductase [Lactobacillus sp. LL6]|uniref:4-hydroxy-tetrahydrodipicolinate reductase n=1 Tax=Lactobacillus sp. LL6 TaxID=2596827 RepID=UPI0011857809|nr:4-hydroxy-tetrahydrodipicolinate reductase [Lactobacillus sp. LL6]TSO26212.1 4-hydroxy-tetrahydrodipicolinate reductase [Lactobacillus sp. LL6]